MIGPTFGRFLRKLHLRGAVSELAGAARVYAWHLRRDPAGVDRRLLRSYLDNHPIRKLHIACGQNPLDGWLNTELYPRSDSVMHLDATRPFPFGDGELDYIYSEHMIEHITHPQTEAMVRECFRVLKPGGKIRLATPDLAALLDLYRETHSEIQRRFMEHFTATFIGWAPEVAPVYVINNHFHNWYHKFIFDERSLRTALERGGFDEVTRCGLQESDDEHLRNLANESRAPEGVLRHETLVMEGTKPARG